jgi:hypothetical protein
MLLLTFLYVYGNLRYFHHAELPLHNSWYRLVDAHKALTSLTLCNAGLQQSKLTKFPWYILPIHFCSWTKFTIAHITELHC